jgi:hypothetical protein
MLKVILTLKPAIIYTIKNTINKELINNSLNDNDWEILSELFLIFEIFIKPSVKLQG